MTAQSVLTKRYLEVMGITDRFLRAVVGVVPERAADRLQLDNNSHSTIIIHNQQIPVLGRPKEAREHGQQFVRIDAGISDTRLNKKTLHRDLEAVKMLVARHLATTTCVLNPLLNLLLRLRRLNAPVGADSLPEDRLRMVVQEFALKPRLVVKIDELDFTRREEISLVL